MLQEFCKDLNRFDNIIVASDAVVADHKLNLEKFALILMDQRIPKSSGCGLIELFNDDFINSSNDVLVISGYVDEKTRSKYTEYGVTHFLSKPFNPAAFHKMALKIIDHH